MITDGDCPSNYFIERTWTATDECGNTNIHIQIISVEDTTPPALTSELDEEVSVSCEDIPDVPELEFEDACSNDITVDFIESQIDECSGEDYQIIRTWTVTDECNNVAIYEQIISVSVPELIGLSTSLCNDENFEFDLFNLLSGDYSTDGTWEVTSGDATIDGSILNPIGLATGDYEFTYYDSYCECPRETVVSININDDCRVEPCILAGLFEISKAVTPNGDMYNEYFKIDGVDLNGGCTVDVQLYNRWGAMIYEARNYQNNWNGFSHDNSVGSHGKVPTGTYYYIINLNVSGETVDTFTGYIYVGTK